jgi:hypothetical protein
MAQIVIKEEITDVSCLTNLMEIIKNQISQGYTSGYYPTWELVMTEEERIVFHKSVEEDWEG